MEQRVFGDVRACMKQLLDHIQESGELERYWNIVEKENEEARKAARKLEKERKRLEMGSDYEVSEDEEDEVPRKDEDSEEVRFLCEGDTLVV